MTLPADTDPSAEAWAAARHALRNFSHDWNFEAGVKSVALEFDRFRTGGVREWQPIETAPKDGTQIILTKISNGFVEQIDVGGWEISPGRDDPGGYDPPWQDWTSNYGIEEPTHWMLLPEPPHG